MDASSSVFCSLPFGSKISAGTLLEVLELQGNWFLFLTSD